ncbi:FadR/GntR family transcriptional regulator [Bradyrhizobium cajani]|uniref:FCD domain-containing protein n=1 Tax=Bradyrhizobium cajani TaxID=1928661 RepID=A0A844T1N6_9BRAD|nr:FadR/GntR family transcriptional regulator [Bradyrhizobium cajani]MCP3372018.1 FadR family transcriptional regulator [Bradyrhizobium cajani]MVT72196.1 FCD domain-containing protein [Bradyrhizobium cajani]
MPLEAVEARRLYRQVADQLRSLIDSGEYAVGSRLPTERELAEQLRVSRPTVREALIALEVEGRLRIRVGSGIYVIEPAAVAAPASASVPVIEGPFELLRAREFLESAIAEQAARVATKDDVARIDASLVAMENVEHPGEASMVHDRAFHIAIAGSLGNAVLVRVVGELFDQRLNPYFAQLAHYFESPGTWRTALDEHRAVRDAIAAHDPQAAREAMRDHLARSQERFAQNFGAENAAGSSSGRSRTARTTAEPSKPKHAPKKNRAASSDAARGDEIGRPASALGRANKKQT